MLLLFVVGGFLILFNEQELSEDMVPSVRDGSSDVALIDDSQPNPPSITNTEHLNSSTAPAAVNRAGGKSRTVSRGGSEDVGLTHDDSTVFPDGVDPRKATIANIGPPSDGAISPAEALSMIGVSSSCSSIGCAVTAVREGSIAAIAGIQNGDLISAIDGRPVSSSKVITGMFTINELTLVRSGRKMTVSVSRR
jgi:membrane-associated protease RseP (regulator of RpoE activity)